MTTCIVDNLQNKNVFLPANNNEAVHVNERDDQTKSPHESPTSIQHGFRKRSRTMMASSPHFETPASSVATQGRKMRSSLHFQNSPSSTFGSVRSMGPLINKWTSRTSGACQKNDDDATTSVDPNTPSMCDLKICHTRHPIIQSAITHFQGCQLFQKRLRAKLLPADSSSLSCTLLLEVKLQYAVRHLCPHQCFLKAYAPIREWVYFRKEVHERTDQPIDKLLHGWGCRLVPLPNQVIPKEGGNGSIQEDCLELEQVNIKADSSGNAKWEAKPKGAIHPKTEFFCSNTNKSYRSSLEALRALGLEDSRKKIRTIHGDSETGSVIEQWSEDASCLCNIRASGDLLLSRIPPPYSDTRNTTSKPLLSKGRRSLWKKSSRQAATVSASLQLSLLDTTDGRSPLGLLEELFVRDPWRLLVSAILLNRSRRAQVDYILWGFLEQWPTPQALLASSNEATKATDVVPDTNNHDDLRKWLQPLGLQTRRSQGLVRFCKDYLALLQAKRRQLKAIAGMSSEHPLPETSKEIRTKDVTESIDPAFRLTRDEILGLYNCGEYVADAYQIFIANHAISNNEKVDWKALHPKDHALMSYVEWKRSIGASRKQFYRENNSS